MDDERAIVTPLILIQLGYDSAVYDLVTWLTYHDFQEAAEAIERKYVTRRDRS